MTVSVPRAGPDHSRSGPVSMRDIPSPCAYDGGMSTAAVLTIHDGWDEHFPLSVTDLAPDLEIALMIDGSSVALDLDGAIALRDHLDAWINRTERATPARGRSLARVDGTNR